MVAIPFPSSSTPGARPAEGQGRLVNAYAQRSGDTLVWRRVPGLRPFAGTDETGPRGGLAAGNLLYYAFKDRVLRFDAAGAATALSGALDGSAPVTMARNNRAPTPDIVCVSENGAFVLTGAAVTSLPDPDLPQPNSVAFLDGYFLFTIGDGRIFASDLNDTAIDALSFAKAEAKADGLLRGIVSGGLFYGFGPASTEVWQNLGTAPFPLGRAAVIPVGLAGPWAVAGFEDGWDGPPVFVAADGTVRRMNGYQPEVISTPDVERAIAGSRDRSLIRAQAYALGGFAAVALSGEGWTFEFNVATGAWHERLSHGHAGWRGVGCVNAFGRWIVGDALSGSLHEIADGVAREGTAPLVFEVESGPVKRFPARIGVRRADFDLVVGQGSERGFDPIETAPQVMISWSDDGGASWSVPLQRPLGRQGEARSRVTVFRTGRTSQHGRRWRLRVSDPVHVGLLGGEMLVEGERR